MNRTNPLVLILNRDANGQPIGQLCTTDEAGKPTVVVDGLCWQELAMLADTFAEAATRCMLRELTDAATKTEPPAGGGTVH